MVGVDASVGAVIVEAPGPMALVAVVPGAVSMEVGEDARVEAVAVDAVEVDSVVDCSKQTQETRQRTDTQFVCDETVVLLRGRWLPTLLRPHSL